MVTIAPTNLGTMAASEDRATCGNLGSRICLTDANFSDDLFLFYKQFSNRNTFLSVGLALASRSRGLTVWWAGMHPTGLEDSSMSLSISRIAGAVEGIAVAIAVSAHAKEAPLSA